MENYRFEEFSFAKVAEHFNHEIISLNFVNVECNYEDGTSRETLCVDYRFVTSDGRVTQKRLFPRYAMTDAERTSLDGKVITDVLFRHGFTTDPDTGEEIAASNKWTAYRDLDGEWHFFSGRKSDWESSHPEDNE